MIGRIFSDDDYLYTIKSWRGELDDHPTGADYLEDDGVMVAIREKIQ